VHPRTAPSLAKAWIGSLSRDRRGRRRSVWTMNGRFRSCVICRGAHSPDGRGPFAAGRVRQFGGRCAAADTILSRSRPAPGCKTCRQQQSPDGEGDNPTVQCDVVRSAPGGHGRRHRTPPMIDRTTRSRLGGPAGHSCALRKSSAGWVVHTLVVTVPNQLGGRVPSMRFAGAKASWGCGSGSGGRPSGDGRCVTAPCSCRPGAPALTVSGAPEHRGSPRDKPTVNAQPVGLSVMFPLRYRNDESCVQTSDPGESIAWHHLSTGA